MSRMTHHVGRITAVLAALSLSFLVMTAPAAAQAPAAAGSDITVAEAVVGTGIEDRAPVGVADTFRPGVERLYFFTAFEGDFPQTQLEHVWLREGEEVARVSLRAQGPRWRTWSSKEISPDWTGAWEVQVVGPGGDVLTTASFTIDG